ncbi:hypothetical protein TNCV_1588131 [Trichonephila clavipes]|uniref:Uncharacterized protein n=1 Tax=Trichonephila clavipes TaxID=2585209 RepID=A0A8X6RL99_TRICX|nr:hypothetical protein TNCV_1588131 [Trichonephila clavipes]
MSPINVQRKFRHCYENKPPDEDVGPMTGPDQTVPGVYMTVLAICSMLSIVVENETPISCRAARIAG